MIQKSHRSLSSQTRASWLRNLSKPVPAFCSLLALFLIIAPAGAAQDSSPDSTAPKAKPENVASIDATLQAVYSTISGPAGQKRDWGRFRSLFVPGARLIPVAPKPGGGAEARMMSLEDYITGASGFFRKNGFFETEIARRTEQFGNIAHVFSTYESRRAKSDAKALARGINSFQLLKDGDRWWIVNIFWGQERDDTPIPEKYLRSK